MRQDQLASSSDSRFSVLSTVCCVLLSAVQVRRLEEQGQGLRAVRASSGRLQDERQSDRKRTNASKQLMSRSSSAELMYSFARPACAVSDWAEASGALLKCAEILEKQKDSLEAAAHYVEAGLCMARVDNEEAIKLLEMGIAIHTNEARLGAAARVWKELAQLHEDEENLQAAIEAWRKAADCQESEGTLAGALQSLLRVGELHVKVRRFAALLVGALRPALIVCDSARR